MHSGAASGALSRRRRDKRQRQRVGGQQVELARRPRDAAHARQRQRRDGLERGLRDRDHDLAKGRM
eukprot:134204-Chlamydomonas_euryale.AAC.1